MNRLKFIKTLVGGLALGSILTLNSSCTKKVTTSVTSKSIAGIQLQSKIMAEYGYSLPIIISDSSYTTPNVDWLFSTFYDAFKQELFNKGVVQWDKRFDCDKFANYFTSMLEMQYYVENFQSWSKTEGITVGVVYYKVGGVDGHAINIIYDGDKFRYFEPQTGKEVILTAVEKGSIFFIKF